MAVLPAKGQLHEPVPVLDIFDLSQEAQTRWLKPIEICEILRNHHKFQLSTSPPQKPQSGSLFLFDRKTLRYFRKDGHNWQKKKNGKTIKEAHERLKVLSIEVLHCYYAHGEDNPKFQRRSYWLLDGDLEHIVLVHYREVTKANRSGFPFYPRQDLSQTSILSLNCVESAVASPANQALSPSELLSSCSNEENNGTHCEDETHTLATANVAPFVSQSVNSHNVGSLIPITYADPTLKQEDTPECCNHYKRFTGQNLKGKSDELENMDIISWQLPNSGLGKFTSMDSFDEATWTQLLEKILGKKKLMSSNWEEILYQATMKSGNGNLGSACSSLTDYLHETLAVPELLNKAEDCSYNGAPIQQGMPTVFKSDDHVDHESDKLHDLNKNSIRKCVQSPWPIPENQARQVSHEGKKLQAQLLEDQDNVNKTIPETKDVVVHRKQETYEKQDSFGTWILKALEDGNQSDPLVESGSDLTWKTSFEDPYAVANTSRLPSGLAPSLSQQPYFSIVDYSPEWSYSSGGTKVIVTGIFSDSEGSPSQHWSCMFGEVEVQAEILPTGVLRCFTPPHTPRKVPFYVKCNGRVACSEVGEFDVRDEPCIKKEAFPNSQEAEEETLMQIKFAQMLSSAESSSEISNSLPSLNVDDDEWLRIENLVKEKSVPFKDAKESLLQSLMKQNLQRWLRSKSSHEGNESIHYLDDHRRSVLHLAAALGYEWALAPIVNAGVGINYRDKHGWTALHWAAYCGREKVVCATISANAAAGALTDPTPTHPKGRTAADLASSCGYDGIAGYLAEASLTSHLTSLKLEDTEANKEGVEVMAERSSTHPLDYNNDLSEAQLSLKDTLAAVRNATQAAAHIQAAFRAYSFRERKKASQDESNVLQGQECVIAVAQTHKGSPMSRENLNLAATKIQCKYRAWKVRKNFLGFKNQVVKIQAHVRGHQVRKKYKKILWTVGVLDKAILRWRRKGQGLRGFHLDVLENNPEAGSDDDLLKIFRKQKEEGFEEELSRVIHMIDSPKAQHQYRQMLLEFQRAKMVSIL